MAQAPPVTTIPPFTDQGKLPLCAASCGPLYDANGACVPPNVPAKNAADYTACFCSQATVAPFSSGTAGVCDAACTAPGGLQSIADWFQSACGVQNKDGGGGGGDNNDGKGTATSSTSSTGSGSSGSSGSNSNQNNGDWLSGHWQWVVMLVVLVVGIAGLWVGACIWRRRYLRKREGQYGFSGKHSGSASNPSWGPEGENSFNMSGNIRDSARSTAPFIAGGPVSAFEEEKPRRSEKVKKWISTERT